jgi:hypothetical protein
MPGTAAARIVAVSSSASATAECRGGVLVSGSYGGEYNAWHAAKWGIRGVILNDAGVGWEGAGIRGLPYLDRIGLAGATADAFTCHIADGEDTLAHGVISHVNEAAGALGCRAGETVRQCAEKMLAGPVVERQPPAIGGGKRYTISEHAGEPKVICLDAAPMLEPGDAGAIAITGSHAALFRGRPDGVISVPLLAVFFNDAGVGKDGAGITRLADLDGRGIIAGAVAAASAPIGDSRAIYGQGRLSHVNARAAAAGARPGMPLRDFVAALVAAARAEAV